MSDINNREGVEQQQAVKALRALEKPRRQTDPRINEEEDLALKQMISGVIPEWQETDNKKKRGVIPLLRSWTGEMMNYARIQMKTWIAIKNEHTANVQRRWDNRGNMYTAFQRCKKKAWPEYDVQTGGKEEGAEGKEREK
eukprot:266804-Pleurochrysis_carterae.AAC.1